MTDALGNDIIIDNLYGYSNRNNGILTVIIGTAKKITEKGNVTLNIIHRGSGLYGANVKYDRGSIGYHSKPTVSVVSNTIFPLPSDKVNWVEEKK